MAQRVTTRRRATRRKDSTRRASPTFGQSFLISLIVSGGTAIALGLIARWLWRRHRVRLPGVPVEMTSFEMLNRGLGELNMREINVGRSPFVLTRRVGALSSGSDYSPTR
jgi:hypothetical protein